MQDSDRNPASLSIPGLITARQAAEVLGVSLDYVRRLRLGGWFKPTIMLNGETPLYRQVDVELYRDTHPKLGLRRRVTKPLQSAPVIPKL